MSSLQVGAMVREAAPHPGGAVDVRRSSDLFVRKLESVLRLMEIDHDLIVSTVGGSASHKIGADLGDDSDASCRVMISGWAARIVETPWGERQILDFLVPGDAIGLSVIPRIEGLYRIVTLRPSVTADARRLRDQLRANPGGFARLEQACHRAERDDMIRMVEHTNRLGACKASHAMGHLLLQLRSRLGRVGLLVGDRFPMPLSQEVFHETLGITCTQVYRVLTQMRQSNLIILGPRWCEIPDPAALAKASGLGSWRS